MVQRGLLLLGMMLVVVALVGFVLFRPRGIEPTPIANHHQSVALGLPNGCGSFLDQVNWGGLVVMWEKMPSSPGWEVRYNAARTLARRGSPNTPFDVLNEMLDENQQMRNFRVRLADGKIAADEYAARSTVIIALKAIEEWYTHKDTVQAIGADNLQFKRTRAAIDKLAQSDNSVVRQEAERVKKAISSI